VSTSLRQVVCSGARLRVGSGKRACFGAACPPSPCLSPPSPPPVPPAAPRPPATPISLATCRAKQRCNLWAVNWHNETQWVGGWSDARNESEWRDRNGADRAGMIRGPAGADHSLFSGLCEVQGNNGRWSTGGFLNGAERMFDGDLGTGTAFGNLDSSSNTRFLCHARIRTTKLEAYTLISPLGTSRGRYQTADGAIVLGPVGQSINGGNSGSWSTIYEGPEILIIGFGWELNSGGGGSSSEAVRAFRVPLQGAGTG